MASSSHTHMCGNRSKYVSGTEKRKGKKVIFFGMALRKVKELKIENSKYRQKINSLLILY